MGEALKNVRNFLNVLERNRLENNVPTVQARVEIRYTLTLFEFTFEV